MRRAAPVRNPHRICRWQRCTSPREVHKRKLPLARNGRRSRIRSDRSSNADWGCLRFLRDRGMLRRVLRCTGSLGYIRRGRGKEREGARSRPAPPSTGMPLQPCGDSNHRCIARSHRSDPWPMVRRPGRETAPVPVQVLRRGWWASVDFRPSLPKSPSRVRCPRALRLRPTCKSPVAERPAKFGEALPTRTRQTSENPWRRKDFGVHRKFPPHRRKISPETTIARGEGSLQGAAPRRSRM